MSVLLPFPCFKKNNKKNVSFCTSFLLKFFPRVCFSLKAKARMIDGMRFESRLGNGPKEPDEKREGESLL